MAVVVFILIIAGLGAAIAWNHHHATLAQAGVRFVVPESVGAVYAALNSALCDGVKAKAKSMLLGVRVQRADGGFRYGTKYGDEGHITLTPNSGGGTAVEAATDRLFVGSPINLRPKSGFYALSAAMTRGIYRACGITPGAVRMMRFQNGLQRKVVKQLPSANVTLSLSDGANAHQQSSV